MRIHKEGYSTLFYTALILSVVNAICFFFLLQWSFLVLLIFSALVFLFFLQFFRSPLRQGDADDKWMLSPADGKVVTIEKVFEDEYLKEERLQVSIFMSPLDVHLNRVPMTGKLIHYTYHKGKYLVAFNPKSSDLNERNTIVIENGEFGKVLFRQIAGFMARRIRFFHQEGADLKRGEELGYIKFGSRMDLFLPLDFDLRLEIGQQVFAAETIVGKAKA